MTWTPGACAASAATTLVSLERSIASAFTEEIALPSFSTVETVPAPVTTTSLSLTEASLSVKSTVCDVPAVRTTGLLAAWKPMRRMATATVWPVARAAGTERT